MLYRLASSICLCTLVLILSRPVLAVENAALVELRKSASERIDNDVKYLASDELEGRGPGTAGIAKAAEFIRDEFKKAGLTSAVSDGSFFQPFVVPLGRHAVPEKTFLEITGPDGETWKLELGQDYQAFFSPNQGLVEAPIVFAGYGIVAPKLGYDDYAGLEVEGKFVLIVRREPQQADKESKFNGDKVTAHSYFATKIKQAIDRKAAGVLLVNDPFTVKAQKKDAFAPNGSVNLARQKMVFAHLSQAAANRLLGMQPVKAGDASLESVEAIESHIDGELKPISQPLEGWTAKYKGEFISEEAETVNIAGMIEGEGPLADETIVIGAHYDHLGFGGPGSRRPGNKSVHNGADDNASGTAAIMELARRLTKGGPLKRRVVIIAFSGEERGLLGSKFYAKQPLIPIEKTVAMFNYDMIGNLRDDKVEVHGTGSGSTFDKLIDGVAADSPLAVTKNRRVMPASDHFSFYQKEVPVMFFFTGLTPIYHTPEDDYETLNIDGIAKVTEFSEAVILAAVNADQKPTFQRTTQPQRGGRGVPFLGFVPDYRPNIGVIIGELSKPTSPVGDAGAKVGDLVVSIDGTKVTNVASMIQVIRQHKPNDMVEFVVKRDDKDMTLKVKLGRPGRP